MSDYKYAEAVKEGERLARQHIKKMKKLIQMVSKSTKMAQKGATGRCRCCGAVVLWRLGKVYQTKVEERVLQVTGLDSEGWRCMSMWRGEIEQPHWRSYTDKQLDKLKEITMPEEKP